MADDPDPDRPVARLYLDTRGQGPAFCASCEAENEEALLMEDGGVACPECKSILPGFDEFSKVITSVQPVKLRGAGHTHTDRCRERGCRYSYPEIEEE